MMSPLNPTAADIQKLDDSQLRQLLVYLCEAEFVAANIGLNGITAGGNQTAPDGGIDVRAEASLNGLPFLTRFLAGIQVKAERMPEAKITGEMRPKGIIRESIADLADNRGTYIIASGRDDVTDRPLRMRRLAMKAAIADLPNADDLHLEFYGAGDLARWAATHPGVSLWVSQQVGTPTIGWKPWGSWSAPTLEPREYLLDDKARASLGDGSPFETIDSAINAARNHLAKPRSCVRLVGLSGMGKTRLAEAIFDEDVADKNIVLLPGLAVYGDAGASWAVSPEAIANQLVLRRNHCVLIVDNCPRDLHRRLTEIVQQPLSRASLLTIDFDVGDQQLPDTTTIRLEPADDDLIERLLIQRAPTLSGADRRRIVSFSGGNTRIALALAAGNGGQGLATLGDEELFDRLFLTDRRVPDEDLRRVARAAALVYAFETEPDTTEMDVLARLANVSLYTFQEKMQELLERGLAQQRGVQQAILPQALAVRLANEAFRRIPASLIWSDLASILGTRLHGSFLRRLTLLHDSPGAVAVAERLMAPGADYAVARDSDAGHWDSFALLAPLAPDRALDLISKAIPSWDGAFNRWGTRAKAGRLLLSLAYVAGRFEAAALAIAGLLLQMTGNQKDDQLKRGFDALFQAALSGTMAPPEARFAVISKMLDLPSMQDFGIEGVASALLAKFTGQDRSIFGAHRMSPGWRPDDDAGWIAWFDGALAVAHQMIAIVPAGKHAERRFAKSLGGMLKIDILRDMAILELRSLAKPFSCDAWFAVCRTINSYSHKPESPSAAIIQLENELRPTTIFERFECWILGDPHDWRDPDDTSRSSNWDKFFAHSKRVGLEVEPDSEVRAKLIARAVNHPYAHGYAFGEGLAAATADFNGRWKELAAAFISTDQTSENTSALFGFMLGSRARAIADVENWLDQIAIDTRLARHIVIFHSAAGPIDAVGATRMLKALQSGLAPPESFSHLQMGRLTHTIPNEILADIITELTKSDTGLRAAIDVLHMRYHGADEVALDQSLFDAGRLILATLAQSPDSSLNGNHVADIARKCIAGPIGRPIAEALCHRMVNEGGDWFQHSDETHLAIVIMQHHPMAALNALIGNSSEITLYRAKFLLGGHDSDDGIGSSPINAVPLDALKSWIEEDPLIRAPLVAQVVFYFEPDGEVFRWTEVALWLLSLPLSGVEVRRALERRFHVGSWTGSSSSRYSRRLPLADSLLVHADADVRAWAKELHGKLLKWINAADEEDRSDAQRFE